MASDTAYLPDEELDQTSKVSYVDWISHLLGMEEPLVCDRKNGNMSTPQLSSLAKEVLRFVRSADVSSDEQLKAIVESMHNENIAESRQGTVNVELKFIQRKTWQKLTKNELGSVIGAALGFPFLGDPHIGAGNGVIYKEFYDAIYQSLPKSGESEVDTSEKAYGATNKVEREMKTMPLKHLLKMLKDGESEDESVSVHGTTVPEFQRGDHQWKAPNWFRFIDSGLRDIPMPSIVLGKSRHTMDYPWQVIDGNQRLATIRKIFDEDHKDHVRVTKPWRVNNKMPTWITNRLLEYEFNVEHIIAKDDQELASLYERYNASGRPMSQPQLRVAKHHEVSALHHLLLAISGGPTLSSRISVRHRLGIGQAIENCSLKASSLRKVIPGVSGKITPDEQQQLRQVTEKVYDLYCRVVAYSTYRGVQGGDKPNPTAKQAIDKVFGCFRDGTKAIPVVERLDYIVKEVDVVYGKYSFLSLKGYEVQDVLNEKNEPLVEYREGKSVHGWATHVQCAAFWDLSDQDISLLKHNAPEFQKLWFNFAKASIVNARQNSKSIWKVQDDWVDEVNGFLHELKMGRLTDEDSEERNRLLGEVRRVLAIPEEQRHLVTDGWIEPLYTREQVDFLKKEYEAMR